MWEDGGWEGNRWVDGVRMGGTDGFRMSREGLCVHVRFKQGKGQVGFLFSLIPPQVHL